MQAIFWYRKAAEYGLAVAQLALGNINYGVDGVTPNLTEAAHWYKKAAEQGIALAQYNLAICYEKGYGVEIDGNAALFWFEKLMNNADDIDSLPENFDNFAENRIKELKSQGYSSSRYIIKIN